MSTDTETFATVPLFEGLEHTDIGRILKISENVSASAGDVILREGEPGDAFYIISAGAFEVRKGANVLARLEGLSFFGEMSLVSEAPRVADVVCVEDGRLKKVSIERFNQLLEISDIAAYKMIHAMSRIIAQRLSRLEDRLVH